MAQANKAYNTFVKGIITEASALTFPENASIDEANFILNRDGSRQRRLGMELEESAVLKAVGGIVGDIADNAYQVFRWDSNSSSGQQSYAVIQTGLYVHIYTISDSNVSGSFVTSVNISPFLTGQYSLPQTLNLSFAAGKGKLFIAGRHIKPFYLVLNGAAYSTYPINIKIRDFEGVNDGLYVNENPSTLSALHKYNLYNQGWTKARVDSYFSKKNNYPSNTQIWYVGKNSSDDFDPNLLVKTEFGNTPAPKGHYIVDAFDIDRSSVSGIEGIAKQTDISRPSSVAFYSGRVFYAGLRSTSASFNNNGKIYFSKILEVDGDEGKCYQEADPTSENYSDLIDTDGGVIVIPEVDVIKKLVAIQGSLLVFAGNGVWEINGAGSNFSATNYAVRKVTEVGAISSDVIVQAEGNVMYWADSGIYVLSRDVNYVDGLYISQSVSLTTIQSLYDNIPSESKTKAKLIYDNHNKVIRGLYSDDGFGYTKELVFDLALQAFYKNEIASSDTYKIIGAFSLPISVGNVITYNVTTTSGDNVTTSTGDQITVNTVVNSGIVPKVKYVVITTSKQLTFAEYKNSSFLDWGTKNYSSYLITGYEIAGDTMRSKQINYLVCHFKRTESGFTDVSGSLQYLTPSSCLLQAWWDFADSLDGGLVGQQFQAYRLTRPYLPSGSGDSFKYGQSVITTKNKLRGRGKALSLKFESEEGKDMHILGWAISMEGRPAV